MTKSIKSVRWFVYTVIAVLSLSLNALAAESAYFSILAETMNPVDSSIEFDSDNGYLKTTSGSIGQYIAQINLPHDSKIISAKFYGYDTDTNNISFAVYRYRFNGEGIDVFEQVTETKDTSLSAPGYSELTSLPIPVPAFNTVNNKDYSYGLYLNLPVADSEDLYAIRFLVEAELPASPWDINDDGKLGLEEAIHILRVITDQ